MEGSVRDVALYHGDGHGWIEVITGVMFSGKSEELIRRVRRALIARKRVQLFKSSLDDRYAGVGHISSHGGTGAQAVPIRSSLELAELAHPDTQVFGIDEVQFLDEGIVEVVGMLADRGARVILAGTDMDFRGEPFGPMPHLLAVAETIDKLHAICVVCGNPAPKSNRPLRSFQSVALMPAACTTIRICPGPGCGSGRSTISRTSGPPNWPNCAAFIMFLTFDVNPKLNW